MRRSLGCRRGPRHRGFGQKPLDGSEFPREEVLNIGKARLEANVRDLENALAAIEANSNIPVARTEAIGCFISDLPMETEEAGS